jgi:hypothetical protein
VQENGQKRVMVRAYKSKGATSVSIASLSLGAGAAKTVYDRRARLSALAVENLIVRRIEFSSCGKGPQL